MKTIGAPWKQPAVATDIAVIGMSGQFPDAGDIHSFWENLMAGRDCVHELPAHYLDQAAYFNAEKQPGKTYSRWGGILQDRDCFDPLFFNISPREARSMSPHQRLILQESWKSLEDAGYNPKKLAEKPVGVFIGAEPAEYFHETFTGTSDAIMASRLSYYLNLRGPAMVVNTACSSSGVAIHLACESLRHGESSLALAGGVFVLTDASLLVQLSAMEMLSPTGRCHTFDTRGDGMVVSEGVGVVVLKRLEDAIADRDPILGVIQASGVNQDGASNGITAPSGAAQEELIASVYQRFRINPEEIGYVEAHGTGTRLGDPVEAGALVRAFRRFTDKQQLLRRRQCQGGHRPYRRQRRGCQPDQSPALPQTSYDSWPGRTGATQPADRARQHALLCQHAAPALAHYRRPAADGRTEFIRPQRDECPSGHPGVPARTATARTTPCKGPSRCSSRSRPELRSA